MITPMVFTGPFTPTRRENGEEYVSFEAILAISDRPQADVRIPFWRNALVRVQALGLEQQEAILRKARIVAAQQAVSGDPAGKGATAQDWMTYVLESVREGVVMPRLDDAQIYLLRNRNPHALEFLVDFIWNLSYLNQEYIDGLVTDLTQPVTSADDAAAAGDAASE